MTPQTDLRQGGRFYRKMGSILAQAELTVVALMGETCPGRCTVLPSAALDSTRRPEYGRRRPQKRSDNDRREPPARRLTVPYSW